MNVSSNRKSARRTVPAPKRHFTLSDYGYMSLSVLALIALILAVALFVLNGSVESVLNPDTEPANYGSTTSDWIYMP